MRTPRNNGGSPVGEGLLMAPSPPPRLPASPAHSATALENVDTIAPTPEGHQPNGEDRARPGHVSRRPVGARRGTQGRGPGIRILGAIAARRLLLLAPVSQGR